MRSKILIAAALMLLASLNTAAQESGNTLSNNATTTKPTKNFDNIELISDLLDLFNLARLGRQWSAVSVQLTEQCRTDMTDYLHGLNIRKLWALKSKFFYSLSSN